MDASEISQIRSMIEATVLKRLAEYDMQNQKSTAAPTQAVTDFGSSVYTPQPSQDIPFIYEATADATFDTSDPADEHWTVTVERVLNDGTLSGDSLTKRCIGASGDPAPITSGERCVATITNEGTRVMEKLGSGFDVRGTEDIYKVVMLRAYLTSDDSLVPIGTAYNPATMYLYPTWDWPRER